MPLQSNYLLSVNFVALLLTELYQVEHIRCSTSVLSPYLTCSPVIFFGPNCEVKRVHSQY